MLLLSDASGPPPTISHEISPSGPPLASREGRLCGFRELCGREEAPQCAGRVRRFAAWPRKTARLDPDSWGGNGHGHEQRRR
jgi:hypothetical protein